MEKYYRLSEIDAGGKRSDLLIRHATLDEAKMRAEYLRRTYRGLAYEVVRVTATSSIILKSYPAI
jgi:hypothetical protein